MHRRIASGPLAFLQPAIGVPWKASGISNCCRRSFPTCRRGRAWRVADQNAVSTIAWNSYPASQLAETLAVGEPAQRHAVGQELTARLRHLTRADLYARSVTLVPLLRSVGDAGNRRSHAQFDGHGMRMGLVRELIDPPEDL